MSVRGFGAKAGGWLVLLAVLGGMPAAIRAGEPAIRNLGVRGLQIGGTTSLVVDGDELGTAPRLLLPFPARQQLKPGAKDNQATFDVSLDGNVVPGYYQLRVVTEHGISLPVVIAVDRLPQRPLTPTIEQVPVALHGTLGGSTTVETRFPGKAGQKLLVEVEAQRLGSKLRPVVHLYSPKKLQVAWSWPSPSLHGDARLEATLPEDGTYTVAVHDMEYAGQAPGHFRLRVGQWSSVDHVFPPAVAKGRPQAVELLGLSPPATVDLPAPAGAGVLPLAWPKDGSWSGPRPFVLVSPHAEILGQTQPAKVQELPAGVVGVSGRLLTPYAEDRYRVAVTPGTKLRLEVYAERHGSPLDAALVVRNDKGDQLARAEDSPGSLDPVLDYPVPANVKEVVVGVVDAQGRGGPRAVYRLVVEPQRMGTGDSDFRLLTPAQRVSLPVGGRAVIPVLVDRKDYMGAVEVAATGLPGGLRLEGGTIPAEADGALVTVQRSDWSGEPVITHWTGRAASEERPVVVKGSPMEQVQPWLATELAIAPVAAKAAEFQIDWRNLPPDAGLFPGKKITLPVKLTRPADKSTVRLTLLTSQLRPLVNGQTDQNQALKLEKAVELGPKGAEGEATVVVPAQLVAPVYDVTLQAELLSEKKQVMAVAYAPVRRMEVRLPVLVKLDGLPRIETALNPKTGATVKVQGQVERRDGATGDVALTLAGLPPGVSAAPVTVKTGTTAFALNLVLPPNFSPGEIRGLKLSGTIAPDAKQPNVRIKSRDVELTLVVTATK